MLRTSVLCCAAVGVLALAVGCNMFSDSHPDLKKRDEAVKALNNKLEELDKKTADLKAKADKAVGEEKARLEAKWKESAGKRAEAAKKLDELKSAAADKWEGVKKDADRAIEELTKAVSE